MINRTHTVFFVLAALTLWTACSEDVNPVGPSVLPSGGYQVSSGGPNETAENPATGGDVEEAGEFACEILEEVAVRFSSPGYLRSNKVGLYVKFVGVPAGQKKLRIWWDFENEPARYQDIEIGDGEVRRDDETLFDIESVIEHVYKEVTQE